MNIQIEPLYFGTEDLEEKLKIFNNNFHLQHSGKLFAAPMGNGVCIYPDGEEVIWEITRLPDTSNNVLPVMSNHRYVKYEIDGVRYTVESWSADSKHQARYMRSFDSKNVGN